MKTGFVKTFTGSNPSSLNTLASYVNQAKNYPVGVNDFDRGRELKTGPIARSRPSGQSRLAPIQLYAI